MADEEAEKAARKKATLDALKKRGQDQIDDSMITTSDEAIKGAPGDSGEAGKRYGPGGFETRTVKSGYKKTPEPAASPSPGAGQAAALRTPPSPAPSPATKSKSFDEMSMEDLAKESSLPAKAAYNRRKAKGEK